MRTVKFRDGMEWSGMKGYEDGIANIDIYEGDKIKAVYLGKEIYEGIVVFADGAFCIKIEKVPKSKKSTSYDVGQTPELNNFEYIEIVENIY